jgi:hypothetical protein
VDDKGAAVGEALIKSSVDRLIAAGRVVNLSGQKRGNGLFPAVKEADETPTAEEL